MYSHLLSIFSLQITHFLFCVINFWLFSSLFDKRVRVSLSTHDSPQKVINILQMPLYIGKSEVNRHMRYFSYFNSNVLSVSIR